MFENLLGGKVNKNSAEDKMLLQISEMNITEMRSYMNDKTKNMQVSEMGVIQVVKNLTILDEKTSKRYIEIDDMDSKKKKGFELIILLLNSKKISVKAIELTQTFIEMSEDVIVKFDKDYKDIYKSKLQKAVEGAMLNIDNMTNLREKMRVLDS